MSITPPQSVIGSRLSDDDYAAFHVLRKSYSTMDRLQGDKFKELITSEFGKYQGKKIRVMSVGSGTGDFDLEIIKIIQQLGIRIKKYVCIEPIKEHINPLKQNLLTLLASERIEIFQGVLEKYSVRKKFHLIHSVHVIHWVAQPVAWLQKIEAALKEEGKSVTVLQSIHGVPRLYKHLVGFPDGQVGYLTAEELFARMYESSMVNYSLNYVPAELNVDEIIAQTAVGRQLLQFLISKQLSDDEFENALPAVHAVAENSAVGNWIIKEPFAFITSHSQRTQTCDLN